ncbi:Uma2 family endonuclease [bacterium]|nr:Uma2 family endonuclease [bacterium]
MNAASLMLEIPEVRARVSPITVAQYQQFPEFNENGRRTELIHGVVIEKMSKSPLHSSIASALYDRIHPQVPPGFWLRKEEPLTLRDSQPEPDLSLVRGHRTNFAVSHPTTAALVIEIAVTSAAEDRTLASLYAAAGVEEYWIVLPLDRTVEVYRNPVNGIYLDSAVVEWEAMLECASFPAIRIRLAEVFA